MPVSFCSGTFGGRSANGIWTFVYCGLPKPCIVQRPGTSTGSSRARVRRALGRVLGPRGEAELPLAVERREPGDPARSSVACGGSRFRLDSSGSTQLRRPPR